jgi:UDP-N-acetylglucosamine 2-epimerase (non-hydrolysing)
MLKKVLIVCGTRPEIIKMAPVYSALAASKSLAPVLLHTGQHTDLATPLYSFFNLPVDHSLTLNRKDNSLAALTSSLLEDISAVIKTEQPAAVLVHGDTSTCLAAALAAFYAQIPVGHVEAGLRTYDPYSPFPEEMNRCLVSRLAKWHYAPTVSAKDALVLEGISPESILITGNTVIDSAKLTAQLVNGEYVDEFVEANALREKRKTKRLVLVTAHRRENWGDGLVQIANGIADLAQEFSDLLIVWPLHANPAVAQVVRNVIEERGLDSSQVLLCGPLGYPTLIWLLHESWVVLTDSGGIQEEAAAFGAPVLVLRDSTERPELIEAGGGVLVGANKAAIVSWVQKLHTDNSVLAAMQNVVNPFGDGTAAMQIAQSLEAALASDGAADLEACKS